MINEIWVYSLYENILKASSVIEGRFVVMDGDPGDINTANFGQRLKDIIDGLKITRKYPAVVMLAPLNIDQNFIKNEGEIFKNNLLFLTEDGKNGDGTLKTPNNILGLSDHPPRYDWADMKAAATNFLRKLHETLKSDPEILQQYRFRSVQQIIYSRCSLLTTERLNGIRLSFDTIIQTGCDMSDYDEETEIIIPSTDLHPLHKL